MAEWTGHLLRTAPWALPPGPLADSEAPQAWGYYFTCLSRKSQAVEKKRRDQVRIPPATGVRREERKGQVLRAKKQQDSVGMQFYFTDSIRAPAPAYCQYPGEPGAGVGTPSPPPDQQPKATRASTMVIPSRLGSEHVYVLM